MAFWNISAGTQNTDFGPDGFPTGTDVDAGTIYFAGTISEPRFQSIDPGISDAESKRYITIVSGVDGISGSNPAGAFNQGDQVIVRVTTDIAGVSNNVLLFGSSNSANVSNSINQIDVIQSKLYKTAMRNGDWNPVDGAFSPAVSVVSSGGWNISAGADQSTDLAGSGTDDAANPTQAIPGELVYHYGSGAQPFEDDYEAKNLW